jgi:hypothetical protein
MPQVLLYFATIVVSGIGLSKDQTFSPVPTVMGLTVSGLLIEVVSFFLAIRFTSRNKQSNEGSVLLAVIASFPLTAVGLCISFLLRGIILLIQ